MGCQRFGVLSKMLDWPRALALHEIMPDTAAEKIQFQNFVKITECDFQEITQRDKPDYLVRYQGDLVGIELTSGLAEEEGRAHALAKQKDLPHYCPGLLRDRPKDSRKTNSEILETISKISAVDAGLSDIRWAHRIAGRIKSKADKLQSGEIESFAKNWLVVGDSSPNVFCNRTAFMKISLMTALGADFLENTVFDSILVISPCKVFVFDRNNQYAVNLKK